jgi:hypothetical protein
MRKWPTSPMRIEPDGSLTFRRFTPSEVRALDREGAAMLHCRFGA